jgi:hypothetical protein
MKQATSSLFDLTSYEKPKPKKINRRNFDFDFIYTDSSSKGLCCMAIQSGLKYGIQSGYKGCVRTDEFSGKHKVTFVDCDYKKYNHEKHLKSVKEFKPKYATVRDIMSEEQCKEAGIEYFPLNQILDYAYELKEYADNVILIPKIDVIDQIPDGFMLGYSIPTSHGGTTVPINRFNSHKVHLLGGSWEKQLYNIERYNFIVSCDNNHLNKIAIYGQFNYPDGKTGDLKNDFNLEPVNHWHVATVLSFGNIAQKLSEIFGEIK